MSYWFGLTIEKCAILVSDRRRIHHDKNDLINDGTSKIFKINNSIYLSGSGLLPFVEDLSEQLKKMFNTQKFCLERLKDSYEKLQEKLQEKYQYYNDRVLHQLKSGGLDIGVQEQQCTSVLIGAVSDGGIPLLLSGYSVESFKIHEQTGSGKFICLPPLNPSLESIFPRIRIMIAEASKVLSVKDEPISRIREKVLLCLPAIIKEVAAKNASVSSCGNIVIIAYNNSWEIPFD